MFKKKSPFEQEAKDIYAQCLELVRIDSFYIDYKIEDSMESRFDLMLAHIYLIIEHNINNDKTNALTLNQSLFDALFADMDQTLREMGIGDMGLPKRIKKMMLGFNGRQHSYKAAFDALDESNTPAQLEETIAKNIYASRKAHNTSKRLASYLMKQRQYIKTTYSSEMITGQDIFNKDLI